LIFGENEKENSSAVWCKENRLNQEIGLDY